MTHVNRVEAFAKMLGFCTGYGAYNPGSPKLRIEALVSQLDQARLSIDHVMMTKTQLDNEVNLRKQTFDQLPRLASGILRILESSGAKHEKVNDARFFARMITGFSPKNRLPIPSEKMENKSVHRSQMQLAYVSQADSFSKLVQTVITEPLYQPLENYFNQTGLEDMILKLNRLNLQVSDARGNWRRAIIERNRVLYASEASMCETGQAVKKYVRAIYGHDSEQYDLVKSLKVYKPGKK